MAMVEQLAQLVPHLYIHLVHLLAVVVEVVAVEPLKATRALLQLMPHYRISRTRALVLQMLVETLEEASEDRSAAMSKDSLEEG